MRRMDNGFHEQPASQDLWCFACTLIAVQLSDLGVWSSCEGPSSRTEGCDREEDVREESLLFQVVASSGCKGCP